MAALISFPIPVAGVLGERLREAQVLLTGLVDDLVERPGWFSTRDLVDAAVGIEQVSRLAEFAQLAVAGALDRGLINVCELADEPVADDDASGRGAEPEESQADEPQDWGAFPTAVPRVPVAEFRPVAEVLTHRLRITRAEVKRRFALATALIPGHALGGEPLSASYPLIGALAADGLAGRREVTAAVRALDEAAVKIRSNTASSDMDSLGGAGTPEPAETSTEAPELLARMEHSVARVMAQHGPEFLHQVLRRWETLINQDGKEPNDAELRLRQGIWRKRTSRGLTQFELWADQYQTETLLTVINAGTGPRTTEPANSTTERGARAGGMTGIEVSMDGRSRAQQGLDALTAALGAALRTNELPMTGGHRPQILLHMNHQQTQGETTAQHGGKAEDTSQQTVDQSGTRTSLGFTGPVRESLVEHLLCDGNLTPVLFGQDGQVLDLGRTRRLFTPTQRLALTARDRGCTFPGCTIPAPWCEAHHIQPWHHNGPTDISNGTLLCSRHHHLIHQNHWTITPNPGTGSGSGSSPDSGCGSGRPYFIPPPWTDPGQHPLRNIYHHL
ncbi:HNH endonuclease signature motif containing protein [Psychromicrobium xiongbiense]|uniref:HNH endonuclease signature motif containing protein n=1 Tax=Psychromicrobium xiongbiense TaxID=3051184 RepID=UPI002553BF86|nr:HNH endonuclease signature motif containing protein [Psychromicrobium sp. YIM S02556]